MRFGPNVVEHAPFSIPMIGNTETGYVIGLTPEGAAVCHRMFTEDVPEAEVAAVHADLPAHLRRGGFVVEGESADGVEHACCVIEMNIQHVMIIKFLV